MVNAPPVRAILIGGPSNAGKSTLARVLAERLGWAYQATDKMARHPGRPWRPDGAALPEHVIRHYQSKSIDELFAAVVRHYQSMWPAIAALLRSHCDGASRGLVLEGSAIWPDSLVGRTMDGVAAVWLLPSDRLLQERIYAASGFAEAGVAERAIIDKFLGRALKYNAYLRQAVGRYELDALAVTAATTAAELADQCLQRVSAEGT